MRLILVSASVALLLLAPLSTAASPGRARAVRSAPRSPGQRSVRPTFAHRLRYFLRHGPRPSRGVVGRLKTAGFYAVAGSIFAVSAGSVLFTGGAVAGGTVQELSLYAGWTLGLYGGVDHARHGTRASEWERQLGLFEGELRAIARDAPWDFTLARPSHRQALRYMIQEVPRLEVPQVERARSDHILATARRRLVEVESAIESTAAATAAAKVRRWPSKDEDRGRAGP